MEADWSYCIHKLKNVKGCPLSSESRREAQKEFFWQTAEGNNPIGSGFVFLSSRAVRE